MPDFLPRRDADLLQWSRNFDAKLNADPQAYGVSSDRAAAFHDLWLAFADALAIASAPGTRTGPSITAKDEARDVMNGSLRELKAAICANSAVSDTQRVQLGCKPRRVGKAPIRQTPTSAPGMQVLSREGWQVTVRLYDRERIGRRRPATAATAMVFTFVGEMPPPQFDGWVMWAGTTKPIIHVAFPSTLPMGTRVWIKTCWMSSTNKAGPAGTIDARLAGGTLNAA